MRVRILAALAHADASPVRLARELDAGLNVVAYHVRTLAQLELVEIVSTHQRRGAVEHVYRAVPQPLGPIAADLSLALAEVATSPTYGAGDER